MIGIMSLVISGGLAILRVQLAKQNMDVTKERVQDIQVALEKYKAKYGHLPCPAPLKDVDINNARFGHEDVTTTNSTALPGGSRDCKDMTISTTGTFRVNGAVRIGAVPVLDLGLPAEAIADKWGRRFIYAVSETLADKAYPYNADNGAITLYGGTGTDAIGPKPGKTPFVLFSTGRSGTGGYTYTAGKSYINCPTGGEPEQENCDLSNTAFHASTYSESNSATDRFDDIVVNDFQYDPMITCGAKGMIYGPTHAKADPDGCVSGLKIDSTTGNLAAGTIEVGSSIKVGSSGAACDASNKGSLRFDSSTTPGKMQYCDGAGAWKDMGGGTCIAINPFNFTKQENVDPNVDVVSDTVTLGSPVCNPAGTTWMASCTGCTAIAKNGTWGGTTVSGFKGGDTIALRLKSPGTLGTAVSATVQIADTTSLPWIVTTRPPSSYGCTINQRYAAVGSAPARCWTRCSADPTCSGFYCCYGICSPWASCPAAYFYEP